MDSTPADTAISESVVLEKGRTQTTDEGAAASAALTSRTVGAMRWSYLSTAVTLLLQLIYTAVMSRLLAPAAFGVVALGGLLLRFVTYFAQMGIVSAVVQRPLLDERDKQTAFTLTLAISGAVALLVSAASSPLARIFGAADLTGVLRGLAASLVITAVGGTAAGTIRRSMRFRALAACDIGSFAVGYLGVGVLLARAGAGVWSLVGASIAQSLVYSASAFSLAPHPVAPRIDAQRARSLISFGGPVSVISLLEFLTASLDTLTVGLVVGAQGLGFYNRASLLVSLPAEKFATSATGVLLPSMSSIQSDRDRVARAYEGGLALYLAGVAPLCGAIAATSPALVRVLLGAQWDPVIRLVPLFALASGIALISHFGGVVLESRAALRPKMQIQVVQLMTFVVLLFVVSRVSNRLTWFAVAWVVGESVRHVMYVAAIQHEVGPRAVAVRKAYVDAFMLTAGPIGVMVAIGQVVDKGEISTLGAQSVAGLISFVAMVAASPRWACRREFRERDLLPAVFRPHGSGKR